MNILYLINYAGNAGTEKYVYNLVKAFHGKTANCHFAYNIAGKLSKQMEEMNIPSLQVKMRHPLDKKAAKIIAEYCRKHEIDVIHAQYPRENYIALLAKKYFKRLRVVYTCHLTLEVNCLWKFANKIFTKNNHKIISVCNNGKDILINNGVKADKITVIYNGIFPHERTFGNESIKKELEIDDDAFVITTLARYHFSKGLDYLVRSIKKLKEKTDRKFVLLILGEGELWDEIADLIKSENLKDCVKQLGYRDDAGEVLKACDMYVNSAKCREALSFAILEALDASLPVVATDVGGNSDIISKENDCGILVDYGDEEAMANAILKIMTDKDLYEKYSKNALVAIDTVFNLDKLIEDTYNTYL